MQFLGLDDDVLRKVITSVYDASPSEGSPLALLRLYVTCKRIFGLVHGLVIDGTQSLVIERARRELLTDAHGSDRLGFKVAVWWEQVQPGANANQWYTATIGSVGPKGHKVMYDPYPGVRRSRGGWENLLELERDGRLRVCRAPPQ